MINGVPMGWRSPRLPSGELTFCHGKIHPFFMGKSTISMAMFNCYVSSPEGTVSVCFMQVLVDNFNRELVFFLRISLVGGFNHLEKYEVNGKDGIPYILENKTCV